MVSFISGAIVVGIIFLYGAVGEIITEKSGHLNLGIPGIMCLGAVGGCFGIMLYVQNLDKMVNANYLIVVLMGIIFAILFAGFGGLIYAFLTVTLRANQNVTGLAVTTFGSGLAQFIYDQFITPKGLRSKFSYSSNKLIKKGLGLDKALGVVSELFLNYGIYVYIAIAIAIVAAIILKKKRVGLNLRAVGENPATADAVGINVVKYKYLAIIIGSAIAGLGGLYYVMDYNHGTFDNTSTIEAFGWLAIALVIFTMWKPDFAIIGSIVFGAAYISSAKITGLGEYLPIIVEMLPYLITVIVLIVTSIKGSKGVQPPASLGVNYFREER